MRVTDRERFTTDIPKGKANRLIDHIDIYQEESPLIHVYFKKVKYQPIDVSLFK